MKYILKNTVKFSVIDFFAAMGNASAMLFGLLILVIAIINVLLFPECNRETFQCFLVDYAWRAM